MPSKSKKQHRLMEAVKHNPKFAKKVGIPQSVGRDFVAADAGKRFARGGGVLGTVLARGMRPDPVPRSGIPEMRDTVRSADEVVKRMGRRLERLKHGHS